MLQRLVDISPWDARDKFIGRYLFSWLSVISMGIHCPWGWCNIHTILVLTFFHPFHAYTLESCFSRIISCMMYACWALALLSKRNNVSHSSLKRWGWKRSCNHVEYIVCKTEMGLRSLRFSWGYWPCHPVSHNCMIASVIHYSQLQTLPCWPTTARSLL